MYDKELEHATGLGDYDHVFYNARAPWRDQAKWLVVANERHRAIDAVYTQMHKLLDPILERLDQVNEQLPDGLVQEVEEWRRGLAAAERQAELDHAEIEDWVDWQNARDSDLTKQEG